MLILSFLHAPAGIPLLSLCGLPLARRGALTGLRDGFRQIFLLVHSADARQIGHVLAEDSRLAQARVFTSIKQLRQVLRQEGTNTATDMVFVAADRVWQGNLSLALRQMPEDGGNRLQLGPPGDIWAARMPLDDLLILSDAAFQNTAFLAGLSAASTGETGTQNLIEWHRIQSAGDIRDAERFLLTRLVKPADGLISRHINRKMSLAITRHLMATKVTPNQITAAVLLVGILSGPAILAIGGYGGLVLGGLLYYLASVLDGCDGELSRLRFQGTPYGAWLDTVVDDTVGLSYILGLYGWLFTQDALWGWVGGTAILCYLLTLGPRYYMLAVFLGDGDYQKLSVKKPRPANAGGFLRTIWLFEDTVCRIDFITFAAPVTALLHGSEIFAVLFMLGTIGTALDSLATFYAMKKKKLAGDRSSNA